MNKVVVVILTSLMFILMVVTLWALMDQAKKGEESERLAKTISETEGSLPDIKPVDYSIYETIVGGEGREMVKIPKGVFTLGDGVQGDFDEKPERVIYLDAYYMDKYEVSQADYKTFARAVERPLPQIPVFEDDVRLLTGDPQPVVGVMWVDAFAYCQWAGKRLPTEAEWEKAARGEDGLTWPWGDTFHPTLANGKGEEDGFKYSSPVNHFEKGRSPYGLYNMAGNVSEWVSDWYDQFYYQRADFKNPKGPETPDIGKVLVYRGGSFSHTAHDLRGSKRFGGAHPERGERSVGFRCAMDAES